MKSPIEGYTKWLNDHATYDTYNTHPIAVKTLCDVTDTTENFDKLSKAKSLVLLTKAPMGEKFKNTFLHSIVNIPIIPDDLRYVAKVGMNAGTGMEIEPKLLFLSISDKYKPDLIDPMKFYSRTEFINLKANEKTANMRFKCFCILFPALEQAIQTTYMTYEDIITMFQHIKLSLPPPTSPTSPTIVSTSESTLTLSRLRSVDPPKTTTAGTTKSKDDILLKMAEPYDIILYFYRRAIIWIRM